MNANTKPYWRQFRRNLVSPKFHWFFLKTRLKANLIDAPFYRRLMSIVFILAVVATVTVTNSWVTFLVAWVFPLTFLYHISALCHLTSEHLWGNTTAAIENKSHSRFCGEAFPRDHSLNERLGWFLRMAFYHLPVRLGVFAEPENTLHNIHHNEPRIDRDWANLTYSAQKQVDEGTEYREYWGLHNAIEAVFQSLADTSPLADEAIQRLIDNK